MGLVQGLKVSLEGLRVELRGRGDNDAGGGAKAGRRWGERS